MLTNLFVQKGDARSDKDLIYMKRLNYALKKILDWYFPPNKDDTTIKILDVTAGERRIWNEVTLQNTSIDGAKQYEVTFLDQSLDAELDICADFRHLPFADESFDLIIVDVPFMKPEHGIEAFGIKTHKTPNRDFYFRQSRWIPPEAHFFNTTREFNRVSRNGLIVKIQERYENGYEIPVTTYMDLAYDKTFNSLFRHKSEFKRCVQVGYRGKRAGMGARMQSAQRVLSYYAVYQKTRHNVKLPPIKKRHQTKL